MSQDFPATSSFLLILKQNYILWSWLFFVSGIQKTDFKFSNIYKVTPVIQQMKKNQKSENHTAMHRQNLFFFPEAILSFI